MELIHKRPDSEALSRVELDQYNHFQLFTVMAFDIMTLEKDIHVWRTHGKTKQCVFKYWTWR